MHSLATPFASQREIERRLDLVQVFVSHEYLRTDLQHRLRSTPDILRSLQLLRIGKATIDDIQAVDQFCATVLDVATCSKDYSARQQSGLPIDEAVMPLLVPAIAPFEELRKLISTQVQADASFKGTKETLAALGKDPGSSSVDECSAPNFAFKPKYVIIDLYIPHRRWFLRSSLDSAFPELSALHRQLALLQQRKDCLRSKIDAKAGQSHTIEDQGSRPSTDLRGDARQRQMRAALRREVSAACCAHRFSTIN